MTSFPRDLREVAGLGPRGEPALAAALGGKPKVAAYSTWQPGPPGSSGSDPGFAAGQLPPTCPRAGGARLLCDPTRALGSALPARDPGLPEAAAHPQARSCARLLAPGVGRPRGSDPPPRKRGCRGPGRGRKRELETDLAGAGLGTDVESECWKRALLGQGVLGEGRQRRHAPGIWSRAESRQIFVLVCFVFFGAGRLLPFLFRLRVGLEGSISFLKSVEECTFRTSYSIQIH